MDNKTKLKLITKNTEEVLTEAELESLLSTNTPLHHYIGFEISGLVHLGTGLVCMQKVKDFQEAGVDCSILLADWHSWINDKLGGDREKIKNIGVPYFREGLIAGLKCVGADPNKVKFVLGTELYHNNDDYFATIVEISKHTTLARVKRSTDIMGRQANEQADFARLIYPPMQVADIFIQGLNIAHGGIDQRKAHVIARAVAMNLKIKPVLDTYGKKIKPIAIHHRLLLGLQKPAVWPVPRENIREIWIAAKMSKSIPKSAVFIHDSPDEIREKVMHAFCPPKETEFNPIIDWVRSLVFVNENAELFVKRESRFGGNVTFQSFEEVCEAFQKELLHPEDLKKSVAEKIIEILEPARKHFEAQDVKEKLQQLRKILNH
jgi:tyrosyl-tRNA synthetase